MNSQISINFARTPFLKYWYKNFSETLFRRPRHRVGSTV